MRQKLTNLQIIRRTKRGQKMCKIVNRVDPFLVWRDWYIKREYAKGTTLALIGKMFGISRQAVWGMVWRCDFRSSHAKYMRSKNGRAATKRYRFNHRKQLRKYAHAWNTRNKHRIHGYYLKYKPKEKNL